MARNNVASNRVRSTRVHSFKHHSISVSKKVQQRSGYVKNEPQPRVYHAIQPTPVRCHPDTGFESGAWLFDWSAAPQWFTSQWSTSSGLSSSRPSLLHVTQVSLDQHRRVSAQPSSVSLSSHCHQVTSVWDNQSVIMDAFGHDNHFMSAAPSNRQRVPTPFPTHVLLKEPLSHYAVLQQSRPVMGRIPSQRPSSSYSTTTTTTTTSSRRSSLLRVTQLNLEQHRKVSAQSLPSSPVAFLSYSHEQESAWDNKDLVMDAFGHDNPILSAASSRRERVPTPFPTNDLLKEPLSHYAVLQQSRPVMGRIPSASPVMSKSSTGPLLDSDNLLTTYYTRTVMQKADQNDRHRRYESGVIPVGSVKAQDWSVEDGFDSGAWLFDGSVAPKWLANELFSSTKTLITTPQISPIQFFGPRTRRPKSGTC